MVVGVFPRIGIEAPFIFVQKCAPQKAQKWVQKYAIMIGSLMRFVIFVGSKMGEKKATPKVIFVH